MDPWCHSELFRLRKKNGLIENQSIGQMLTRASGLEDEFVSGDESTNGHVHEHGDPTLVHATGRREHESSHLAIGIREEFRAEAIVKLDTVKSLGLVKIDTFAVRLNQLPLAMEIEAVKCLETEGGRGILGSDGRGPMGRNEGQEESKSQHYTE